MTEFVSPARILLTCVALAILPPAASAVTPEEVVGSYFRCIEEKDWNAAVNLVDPTAMQEFRESLWPAIVQSSKEDGGRLLRRMFGPDATVVSVEKAPDADFYASMLKFMFRNINSVDEFSTTILGSVSEGPDTEHVVVRCQIVNGEFETEVLEVVSCKRTDEVGWKVHLSGDVKGLVQLMQTNPGSP